MRLSTLSNTPKPSARGRLVQPRSGSEGRFLHVNEIDPVDADRERSAQEELKSVEHLPAANDERAHGERAREAAAALRKLGPAALQLLSYESAETVATQIDAVV